MADVPGGYLAQHTHHMESLGGHGGGGGQPPGGGQSSKPTYSKRGKITIVACVPCRRRKTKCDGRRPTCSQCATRESACSYDMNEEQRRLTFLRENVEQLVEEKAALEAVLWNLKSTSDSEASEILRRIRTGQEYGSLVQQIQASRSLTQVKDPAPGSAQARSYEQLLHAIASGSRSDSNEIVQRLRRREPIERILEAVGADLPGEPEPDSGAMDVDSTVPEQLQTHQHVRPMAGNSMAPLFRGATPSHSRAPDAHTPPRSQSVNFRWTTVTTDTEFVEYLLDIYFTWQHTFFQNFPESLFRHDFEAGRTKYCSRVLVNAICAAGCLLSDRPEARADPTDPSTAGAGFFDEGIRLLNLSDRSSIPTTAGVFILSHVEGYRAKLGAMWGLVGRSARMAMDLHLHLRNDKISADVHGNEEQKQEAGRVHAFWGCFVSDQITSLTLGRLPQLLTNAITVELPPVGGPEDEKHWGPTDSTKKLRPGARATTFRHCASLSKVVNSTLLMFFAPSQIIKGSLLLDEYQKYLNWHSHLPTMISSTENAPAHVLGLHMYYHAAVLLLFRPFLRAKFTASPLSPSELCRSAATSISDLFSIHIKLYGNQGLYTFQIQCLLAACTIHLINLPAIASATALTKASEQFHSLIYANTWALRSIRLIRDLVRKWGIILPREVEIALYRAKEEDFPPEVWSSALDDPAAPKADFGVGNTESNTESGTPTSKRGTPSPAIPAIPSGSKRGAFLNPAAQPDVLQKRQRLAPVQQQRRQSIRTSSDDGEGTDDDEDDEEEAVSEQQGEGSSRGPETVLFAPFPNQPVPLLGPIHTSSEPDPSWGEEVKRVTRDFDGLKFEGDGWFDPFMGI